MNKSIKDTLKLLEKTQKTFWNISPTTGQFLNRLILNIEAKKIFEIGTSNGFSGIWMASALKETGGHLYTIESHKKRFALASSNFKKAKIEKHITQIQGHAPEDIPKSPKFYDLIFLDATKYEHIDYLKTLIPHTKKRTIIISDNIHSHKKELATFIKKLKNLKGWKSEELSIGTGLLISQKD